MEKRWWGSDGGSCKVVRSLGVAETPHCGGWDRLGRCGRGEGLGPEGLGWPFSWEESEVRIRSGGWTEWTARGRGGAAEEMQKKAGPISAWGRVCRILGPPWSSVSWGFYCFKPPGLLARWPRPAEPGTWGSEPRMCHAHPQGRREICSSTPSRATSPLGGLGTNEGQRPKGTSPGSGSHAVF